LHLSKTLVPTLDRQIATRNHDSRPRMLQRRKREVGEALEGSASLDLQDDADVIGMRRA
jgi:hypothetical protein